MKQCKNCGREFQDEYCSHCGQKAKVERITFVFIWHELLHFFTHIESGFFFTSWRMLISPGKTTTGFIEGKRKNYQSPISYFLIWIALYILLLYWIEKAFGENIVINYKEYFGPSSTTKLAISHLSLVLTIVIPFDALYLYLLVTQKFYNYFESMTAVIYALGTIILLQFAFAVIALLIHLVFSISVDLKISDILKLLYLAWFIIDFIKPFRVKIKFDRILVFIILAFGTFTLWRLYGVPGIARWFL